MILGFHIHIGNFFCEKRQFIRRNNITPQQFRFRKDYCIQNQIVNAKFFIHNSAF